MRACSLSSVLTWWTVTCKSPLSMGFSRQEYWSGLSCTPPRDLPNPGIQWTSHSSPALQADCLQLSHWGSPLLGHMAVLFFFTFKELPYCSHSGWNNLFPPTVQEVSLFFISSPAFIVCGFFDDVHSDRCEVITLVLSALWWQKWEGNPKKKNICINTIDSLWSTLETNTTL